MGLGKILSNCFNSSSSCQSSCFFCINNSIESEYRDQEELERSSLIRREDGGTGKSQSMRLKDVLSVNQTLAFQLKPKMVVLRVSMHCDGCAKRVEKHISKIDGVTSCKIDLESKMVVVIGDIIPIEVLESVSKVNKYAELWNPL